MERSGGIEANRMGCPRDLRRLTSACNGNSRVRATGLHSKKPARGGLIKTLCLEQSGGINQSGFLSPDDPVYGL